MRTDHRVVDEGMAAELALRGFLSRLRECIAEEGLRTECLPPWVVASKVRYGCVGASLVAAIEDASGADTYVNRGRVHADTVILLDTKDFRPRREVLCMPQKGTGVVTCVAVGDDWGLSSNAACLCGRVGDGFIQAGSTSHEFLSMLLVNSTFKLMTDEGVPLSIRWVPWAVYVHRNHLSEPWLVPDLTSATLKHLRDIPGSQLGDYYEKSRAREHVFHATKADSVIVLGPYTDDDLRKLESVRDHLRRDYSAWLIKDLPDLPEASNEQKVKLWCSASRFCVMLDLRPAGHIAEYAYLKDAQCILALLRPEGQGSTSMIGDDDVDINFIRKFLFRHSPLEALGEAVCWAESVVAKRKQYYDSVYPWRRCC